MMTIFEPLFLLLVVVSFITFVTAGIFAIGGRSTRAGRILQRWTVAAAAYFAIVIVVSALRTTREYALAEPQCFDDWCITVTGADRKPVASALEIDVNLRLTNRARRVPMGERGTAAYLTDAEGHRYDPLADAAALPFDTVIQPGQSVMTFRRFEVPAAAHDLALIYAHEKGFPISWFIIAEGGWFSHRAKMRLE